jgi:hypothetical protein
MESGGMGLDAWFAAYNTCKISPNHVEPLREIMFLDEINLKPAVL